jgi:hypothetical protein
VLTTPNLWRGSKGTGQVSLTSVHESSAPSGAPSQEQITANIRYCDTFGPTVVHTPPVKDGRGNPVRVGFEWNRPIHTDATLYACLPMQLATTKPTVKITEELTDIRSGISLGMSSR